MTDPFDSLASARARVHSQLQDARARDAAVGLLAETVNAATATAVSPRGEVSVTSTAAGVVTDVALTPAALALRPEALGPLVAQIVAQAQRAAAELAVAAAETALGPDAAIVASLRTDVDARFGPPTGDDLLR